MRYRVELARRADGLYGVWRGNVFEAQRSTADGTMLLVAAAGDEPPEDFDTEWNLRPAKVVPEDEADSTFSLQTHCLFDDELFRIAPDPATLTLRWNGRDDVRARQLGLTEFTTTATPDEITALWQERHDFPGARRPEPGTGEPDALVRDIARSVRSILPDGWERVAAQFRQVGDYAEIEIRSVGEGLSVSLSAPPALGQLFARLRAAMYQPGAGTWFQGTLTLEAPSSFQFDYDSTNEPNWRQAPGGGRLTANAYEAELAHFPRERQQIPGWLAAKAGLSLDVTFRRAAFAETPQPVPQEEIRGVLDYLYRAPVVLSRPGWLADTVNPAAPPDVPDAFHTDGLWIWPAAVPHYLRKYGIPPEPELLERIRANGYRVPLVPSQVREAAEADVLGKPRPPLPQESAPDAVTVVDRGGDPAMGLRASEVLDVLERRLAEAGVPESAYRIGEIAEDAWSLRRTKESWEVTGPGGGEPAAFARVEEAARFLVGSLLLYPARMPEPAPVEWPIVPLRGEPPLTFFRSKRMILLPAGRTVLRFGNEAGNLVHDVDTGFPETSLTPDREQMRAQYRLTRGIPVLTGVTLPWGPQPGGAVGYLLPRAIGSHLESGALERV
ncbi:TNT domain-containing protein [Amycolatopsis sp. K13G38]|uniref:TNT domain-containing protein n=1 Tax=Amycolatopsis acididurans TaxID=2724524 RepID=A0ABX1J0H9_9PSEU|nr:TNT domain-containing protein [Amycolatopsis acididurans]NKQ53273.1 TNT domain-containing protein [Amycolatopsis acididurans]